MYKKIVKQLTYTTIFITILALIILTPYLIQIPEKDETVGGEELKIWMPLDTYKFSPKIELTAKLLKHGEIQLTQKNILNLNEKWQIKFLEQQTKKIYIYNPKLNISTKILAEPIKILYNGSRKTISQQTIHLIAGENEEVKEIAVIHQISIFNKASKQILTLTDISPGKQVNKTLQLNLLKTIITKSNLNIIPEKPKIFENLKTAYNTYENQKNITYNLVSINFKNLSTFYMAFWPKPTKIIQYRLTNTKEEQKIFSVQWTDNLKPNQTKRYITLHGVLDGNKQSKLWKMVNLIFNPTDLKKAVNQSYDWIVVGREAKIDLESAKILNETINAKKIAFDIHNPKNPFTSHLLHLNQTAGSYHDKFKRLHLTDKIGNFNVSEGKILVVGSVYANKVAEYFNDFTDSPLTTKNGKTILVVYPSKKPNKFFPVTLNNKGLAVISTCGDLNNTLCLMVWGYTEKDTYYICKNLEKINIQNLPEGARTLIIEVNYSHPKEPFKIKKILGTIIEFNIPNGEKNV